MVPTSGPGSPWERLRKLPGRIPLRVKLITALLALVAVALTIISVASVSVFRDYQMQRASQQATDLFNQTLSNLNSRQSLQPGSYFAFGPYFAVVLPPGTSLAALARERRVPARSLPRVPTNKAWLKANASRLTEVRAISGNDNWRVIARQVPFVSRDFFTGLLQTQTDTLIVGVNLGNINGSINQLATIDLIVSIIVVVGLAVVGVAIVRASLRPLTDIEHTAEAIAAGDLSRRVPDRDPATEIGRLGRSLNAMLTQIETSFDARAQSEAAARRSEERLRRFVADASHELRTPLTAIRGFAEYYRQRAAMRVAGATPGTAGLLTGADLDRIMLRVEQESARMGVLVEDMLLLARLDQQRPLEHRPVDLLALAGDAVQDARMVAPDRPISLAVSPGAAFLVTGDEVRLRQVIGNLMSNALTHTPAGTPVEVRLRVTDPGPAPAGVLLEVADQGPGLEPGQAEHVFERFYRADAARARQTGGTGLGLAIVAALVAAHGGSVAVSSEPGHGASFRIILPLAPETLGDDD